jgi:hypothetical protein
VDYNITSEDSAAVMADSTCVAQIEAAEAAAFDMACTIIARRNGLSVGLVKYYHMIGQEVAEFLSLMDPWYEARRV